MLFEVFNGNSNPALLRTVQLKSIVHVFQNRDESGAIEHLLAVWTFFRSLEMRLYTSLAEESSAVRKCATNRVSNGISADYAYESYIRLPYK